MLLLTFVLVPTRFLDTAHVTLSWHMIYYYLILNFDNRPALDDSVWYVIHRVWGTPCMNADTWLVSIGVSMCVGCLPH